MFLLSPFHSYFSNSSHLLKVDNHSNCLCCFLIAMLLQFGKYFVNMSRKQNIPLEVSWKYLVKYSAKKCFTGNHTISWNVS